MSRTSPNHIGAGIQDNLGVRSFEHLCFSKELLCLKPLSCKDFLKVSSGKAETKFRICTP